MKIDSPRTQGAQVASVTQPKGGRVATHGGGAARAGTDGGGRISDGAGDRVSVSEVAASVAATLRRLVEGTGDAPGADPARLAALRERIENGTLKVDPDALAEAILNHEV